MSRAAALRALWPGLRTASLLAGLGGLAALGQAPVGAWWLTLPTFALAARMILAVSGPMAAAGRAWCAGAGYFAIALAWIVQPFMVDAARDGWMAPFALVFMAVGLAGFWALGAGLAARAGTRNPGIGFVIGLTVAEIARGHLFTGFPWASLGHIWIGTPVDQLAALTGPDGLTFATLVLSVMPIVLGRRGVFSAALLLAGLWTGGMWRLAQPLPEGPDVMVRLVQPNIAQSSKWNETLASDWLGRLISLSTGTNPGGRTPDLIIWPETALPYLLNQHDDLVERIVASGGGATMAFGYQRVATDSWRAWNSLGVLDPTGRMVANYDKHHLVPFGEYIPFGDLAFDWIGLTAFAAQEGQGYSAGPGPHLIDLGAPMGRVLPIICYEAVFPEDLFLPGGQRADWILQITNDAWFGTWSGPFQHAAQARLRAIEQGLPLVRVANTGVSAIYDAHGRTVAALPFGTEGRLDAFLPGALTNPPPYARWGNIPFWLMLSAVALWVAFKSKRSPA